MLIDPKGLKALKKVGLDTAALSLAKQAETFGDVTETVSTTLGFVGEDEPVEGDWIVELTVAIRRNH